jgi:hypothetical protein
MELSLYRANKFEFVLIQVLGSRLTVQNTKRELLEDQVFVSRAEAIKAAQERALSLLNQKLRSDPWRIVHVHPDERWLEEFDKARTVVQRGLDFPDVFPGIQVRCEATRHLPNLQHSVQADLLQRNLLMNPPADYLEFLTGLYGLTLIFVASKTDMRFVVHSMVWGQWLNPKSVVSGLKFPHILIERDAQFPLRQDTAFSGTVLNLETNKYMVFDTAECVATFETVISWWRAHLVKFEDQMLMAAGEVSRKG